MGREGKERERREGEGKEDGRKGRKDGRKGWRKEEAGGKKGGRG